jgi:hypothetical protein
MARGENGRCIFRIGTSKQIWRLTVGELFSGILLGEVGAGRRL